MATLPREKKEKGRSWQRAATRAAIIAAARRLAERGDAEKLSLTAVAREADFAPTTVFAYFANKNDLFLAVLADDLAQFARTMCRDPVETSEFAAEPEQAQEDPSANAETPRSNPHLRLVESSADPAPEPLADAETVRAAPEAGAETIADAPTAAANLHAHGDGFAERLLRLQETVEKLEARPVDQWLERRLREFERGLAAVQTGGEKPDVSGAQGALESAVRALTVRLESVETRQAKVEEDIGRHVRERADQVERRLREELSEIEARHARERIRIDALENAAFAVAPEFFHSAEQSAPAAAKPSESAPVSAGETSDTEQQSGPAPAEPAEPVSEASDNKSFLASARKSAIAAAEQAPAETNPGLRLKRLSKRTLSFIAMGLGAAVVLIWTGVYFKTMAVSAKPRMAVAQVAAAPRARLVRPAVTVRMAPGNTKQEFATALKLLNGGAGDQAQAISLISRAAQEGDALAALKLATLYKAGRDGVTADSAAAFHWFGVAASKGNCKAMQSLAVAYAEGWGTTKNMTEAARWFARAADLGLTDAQFNLAVLYERGLGVPQSLTDAYKWYRIAAAQGDRESQSRVDALKSQLDDADLSAAEEAAASFKAAPLDRDANVGPVALQTPAG